MEAPAEERLGVVAVARELGVSESTARRRLRAWHSTTDGPRVERARSRRGEPAYLITRAELARVTSPAPDEGRP